MKKLVAEAIGTFALVFVGTGAIVVDDVSGGAVTGLGVAFAFGLVIMIMVYSVGDVSGAHFNPAVTLVFAVKRETPPGEAVAYVAVQVLGGLLGVLAAHAMFEVALLQVSPTLRSGAGQWLAEAIATFGLIATILGALRARPQAVAMAVGLYITAAYWFTASTSFANPAVTLARGFTDSFSGIRPADVGPFVLAQFIGALLALAFFVWLERGQRESKRPPGYTKSR